MTLEEIKTEIISRAKSLEVCDKYPDIWESGSIDDLLQVSKDIFTWCYESGIVDDSFLEEATDEQLSAIGVYRNGDSVEGSDNMIYFIGSSTGGSIVVRDYNKCTIVIMGSTTVNIVIRDYAYADIKCMDTSTVNIELRNKCTAAIETTQQSNVTIAIQDDAVCHGKFTDYSTVDFTANSSSYANLKTFNKATLGYIVNNDAVVDTRKYNESTITDNSSL